MKLFTIRLPLWAENEASAEKAAAELLRLLQAAELKGVAGIADVQPVIEQSWRDEVLVAKTSGMSNQEIVDEVLDW
jgi:DNA-directed RNA polymerase subunit F